jgi:hypothetical protein
MMLLKIAAPIFVFLIALAKELLPDKLKDQSKIRLILWSLMGVAMIISISTIIVDDQKASDVLRSKLESERALKSQNDSLKARVDSLISITQLGEARLAQQNLTLHSRISEINSKLEPFVKIAVTRYPTFDIQTALERLTRDIQETKELAKPNSLIPIGKEVSKTPNGYSLKVQFKPTKNVPLGLIHFGVRLPKPSAVQILDFWPAKESGAFESGPDSKQISPDKKSAQLYYSLLSASYPIVELTLTGSAVVTFESNYLEKAFAVEVK